jgi:hypothetical protein
MSRNGVLVEPTTAKGKSGGRRSRVVASRGALRAETRRPGDR